MNQLSFGFEAVELVELREDVPAVRPEPQAKKPTPGKKLPVKVVPGAHFGALLAAETPEDLFQRLASMLDGRLGHLTLTANRRSLLAARPERGGALRLRLHIAFLGAPDEVLRAVADFAGGEASPSRRKAALAVLRAHVERHRREVGEGARPTPRPRRVVLRPVGAVHDLEAIRDEVVETYFGGELEVPITWGREPARRRRRVKQRSIHLGTYDLHRNLIRIHPALDRRFVPRWVVASVVHHELLHAAMPAETVRGRRRIHPPEFRRRERLFARYDEAEAWIRENLPKLLAGT